MLAARITCLQCGNELTVTEIAPPRVSCPRCLAALDNPASLMSPTRPVPVIPLDQQVERDTHWSSYLICGLLILFGLAAIISFSQAGLRQGVFVLVVIGGIVACFYPFVAARLDTAEPERAPPGESLAPPPFPGPGGATVLGYGTPRRAPRPAATPGAVAAGFFGAVGVCAAGFFTLAATADFNPGGFQRAPGRNYNSLILAAVVILVIVFIVLAVRVSGRWRGFGPGAAAGLCLGMLALGPCAACYLLTIK